MSEFSTSKLIRRSQRGEHNAGSRSTCPFGTKNKRTTCGPAVAVIAGVPVCQKHLDVIHAIERKEALGPTLAAKHEPVVEKPRKPSYPVHHARI